MKVLLDTNILIDVLEAREGYKYALAILQQGMSGKISLYASDITFINIAYICRRSIGMDKIFDFFALIRSFIDIIPVNGEQIDEAVAARPKDFEDFVQYAAAKKEAIDLIVTRNTKDFEMSDVTVLTPPQLLDRIAKN